jgi:hypothetical protein
MWKGVNYEAPLNTIGKKRFDWFTIAVLKPVF